MTSRALLAGGYSPGYVGSIQVVTKALCSLWKTPNSLSIYFMLKPTPLSRTLKTGCPASSVQLTSMTARVGAGVHGEPRAYTRCLHSYEGKAVPGQAFGRVARITSSNSLLSAGFWKKAVAPACSVFCSLDCGSRAVSTITGML